MSDTEDAYLDEYVQTLLHEALSDISKRGYKPASNSSYLEDRGGEVAGRKGRIDEREFGPSSPIIETTVLRRSYSSPAVPEISHYSRGILTSRDYSGYDDVLKVPRYQRGEADMAPRYTEYYRGLRTNCLNDNFMRAHDADRREAGADDSFATKGYTTEGRHRWAEFGGSESPTRCHMYRYCKQDTLRSEDEDSYLEECPLGQRRPIIQVTDEKKSIMVSPPKHTPVELDQRSHKRYEPQISRAEQHIDYLTRRLDELIAERDDIIEYLKEREREWYEMSDRLHAEIVDLRQRNTSLLSERFNRGRRLSRRMAEALLKTQQESDKALTTTLERQQKINELHLLVTMQQRYILALEESIGQLQATLDMGKLEVIGQEERGEGIFEDRSPIYGLPKRHPAEGHRYSSIKDVLDCDRSRYTPGKTTNPELATAEIFDFGGEVYRESRAQCEDSDDLDSLEPTKKERGAFDPLGIPYVKAGLVSN